MSKNLLLDPKIIQNGITNWLLRLICENSGVRGCMVIKPYGYAIWEKMQAR
jgi:prolyl-tRNA synthetase